MSPRQTLRCLASALDGALSLLAWRLCEATGRHPRALARAALWLMVPLLVVFLWKAATLVGGAMPLTLLAVALPLVGLHVQGLADHGPARGLASDEVSRLLGAGTALLALLLAAVTPGGVLPLMLQGAALPVLWTAALHLEALPPVPPRRLAFARG